MLAVCSDLGFERRVLVAQHSNFLVVNESDLVLIRRLYWYWLQEDQKKQKATSNEMSTELPRRLEVPQVA